MASPRSFSISSRLRQAGFALALGGALVIAWPAQANRQDLPAWPEPLTLEFALEQINTQRPDVLLAQAEVDAAMADVEQERAQDAAQVRLEARAAWLDPVPSSTDQSSDDHRLALIARKRLYDFGHSRARKQSVDAAAQAESLRYRVALAQQRVRVLDRFYGVLIADQRFARDNEAMAIAYVTFDKVRERHALKEISDVDLMDAEATYEQALLVRNAADQARRLSRQRLANVLGRPDVLPSELLAPKFQAAAIPEEVTPWLERALQHSPEIQAAQAQLNAAQQALAAARNSGGPTLEAEGQVASYSRKIGSREPWQAALIFNLPLHDGGIEDASVAKARAEQLRAQAQLESIQLEVREQVVALWLELQRLRGQLRANKQYSDFRELYLDRSRAEYELEMRTDLGDAMVQASDARLRHLQYQRDVLVAQAQLELLLGESLDGQAGG
jgi:outer membrane protein TolC